MAQQAGGDRRLDDRAVAERVVRALPAGPEPAHPHLPDGRPDRRGSAAACRARCGRCGPIPTGENLEAVPQRAGKYGLKVWHGAWLNNNEKENLEQINLLIDHANKYKDTIERVIVGNEVLLRKDLTANELRRYIRQVKQRVSQPVTYADVWEFWLRNPSLADEVDFITIHILPYWEDEPIGARSPRARRHAQHREAHRRHLQEGAGALSRQEDRDRRDRLAERRPHALRRAARAGSSRCATSRSSAPSPSARSSTTTSSRPSTSTGRRARKARSAPPGACSTPSASDKFELGKPVVAEPHWRMLFTLSTLAGGLMLIGFVSLRRQAGRQGHRDLRRLRPARGDLLRAGDLDRPVAHLLFRAHGGRRVLGAAARPVQLRPAARHRRQPDRQDGRSFALRRARARGVARLARAAALPHRAARRPDGRSCSIWC